jgi:hypothetical protein
MVPDSEAAGVLERAVTARLDAQHRDLDAIDAQLSSIRDQLARVEASAEANAALMSKFLVAIIAGGISIVGSAVAVILLGPSA